MSRDPESVLFEADYWRAALADVLALNDHLGAAARELPDIAIEVIPLAFSATAGPIGESVTAHVQKALDEIAAAQRPLNALIELAQGRAAALRRELCLDEEGGEQ